MPAGLTTAAAVFAFEVREAKKLGFRLQIANVPGAVGVRMVPESSRAKIIAKRHDGRMIESTYAVEDESHRADITRTCIQAVLRLAKDSGA